MELQHPTGPGAPDTTISREAAGRAQVQHRAKGRRELWRNGGGRGRLRIALYSHDTQGLGHLRRNLLLASVFHRMDGEPAVLLVSGARELGAFSIPATVDCLTLPAVGKDVVGGYGPRRLNLPLADVVEMRRRVLEAALTSFDPDVLIVDKAPRGLMNELDPTLAALRGRCRIVLGLREVLDDAPAVAEEWSQGGYDGVIAESYDRVWIYGDQKVFDPVREYKLGPGIAARTRFTGYLSPCDAGCDNPEDGHCLPHGGLTDEPAILCAVGGGQDGAPLARAFLQATLPAGFQGVLVTGPQMPARERTEFRLRAAERGIRIFEFITDCGALMSRASRVITMGGYNTICEVLAHRKPALIVPRITPRTEQLIRASRLRDLGLIDMLHPAGLDGAALSSWLAGPGPTPIQPDDDRIDMRGVGRLPDLLREAVGSLREVTHACA